MRNSYEMQYCKQKHNGQNFIPAIRTSNIDKFNIIHPGYMVDRQDTLVAYRQGCKPSVVDLSGGMSAGCTAGPVVRYSQSASSHLPD